MSDYIDQLASRNLDDPVSTLRPRIGSRFEALTNLQNEQDSQSHSTHPGELPAIPFSGVTPVANQPQLPDSVAGTQEQDRLTDPTSESMAQRAAPAPTVSIVPQPDTFSDEDTWSGLNQLTSRLDQLDARVRQGNLPPVQAEFVPDNNPALQPPQITVQENRKEQTIQHHDHHHTHSELHEDLTQQISQFNSTNIHQNVLSAPGAGQTDSDHPTEIELRPVSPTGVDDDSTSGRNPLVPTPIILDTKRHPPNAPSPIVESAANRTPISHPVVPNIIVSPDENEPKLQHTVTVTIGRIEVRAPQKSAPPARQSRQPSAKIMSLDDYVKRRAGGPR